MSTKISVLFTWLILIFCAVVSVLCDETVNIQVDAEGEMAKPEGVATDTMSSTEAGDRNHATFGEAKTESPPQNGNVTDKKKRALLHAIASELVATEELMRLQERKLSLLGEVRRELLSMPRDGLQIDVEHIINKIKEVQDSATDPMEFNKVDLKGGFDQYLTLKSTLDLGSEILDIQVFSVFGKYAIDLIVVAHVSGLISVLSSEGHEYVTFQVAETELSSIAVDPSRKSLSITTSTVNGVIYVHGLGLWYDGQLTAGNSTTLPKALQGFQITVDVKNKFSHPSANKLHLAIAHFHGEGYIAAFTKLKTLSVYSANGTFLDEFHINENVNVAVSQGTLVAFGNGTNVGFLQLSRMQLSPQNAQCVGVDSVIVSIAFDSLVKSLLYASTAAGDILVFDTKSRLETRSGCKIIYRLSPRPGKSNICASVATIRGYVLSLFAGTFYAHNASEIRSNGLSYVFHQVIENRGSEFSQRPLPLAALSHQGNSRGLVVLSPCRDCTTINIYHSLLPYTPPIYDITWIQTPLILFVVGGVVIWQLKLFKKKNTTVDEDPLATFKGYGQKNRNEATFERTLPRDPASRPYSYNEGRKRVDTTKPYTESSKSTLQTHHVDPVSFDYSRLSEYRDEGASYAEDYSETADEYTNYDEYDHSNSSQWANNSDPDLNYD